MGPIPAMELIEAIPGNYQEFIFLGVNLTCRRYKSI